MRTDRVLAIAGATGAVLALAGIVFAPADALRAWLAAAFLCSGVPVGSLGLSMMMRLIPGKWGHELLPSVEAGMALLPLSALAILPVLLGMAEIYPWFGHTAPGFETVYLNPVFFAVRTLLWFAGLGLLIWMLIARRGSAPTLSAVGLIVLPVAATPIAADWLLSLEPSFHSSGFGLYALSIQFTAALAFAVLAALHHAPTRTGVLGGLMLTMLMLWSYLLFMPYLIAWSGDLAAVVPWYKKHVAGGWAAVIAAAVALHDVPLLALLLPSVRGSARRLRLLAAVVLLGSVLEVGWLVLPEGGPVIGLGSLFYLLAVVGLGCLSVAGFGWVLTRRTAARAPAVRA